MSPSFYQNQSFLNFRFSLDTVLMNHLASLYTISDADRVIYSSNEYSFRKRSDSNNGSLSLPFVNFKLKGIEYWNDRNWYNTPLQKKGVFIEELLKNIKIMPLVLNYECSVWMTREDEMQYLAQRALSLKENHTELTYNLEIDSISFPNIAIFNHNAVEVDPQYTEKDWLERNKIHSIGLDFSINTYMPEEQDVSISETFILDFYPYSKLSSEALHETIEIIIEDFYND